MWFFVAWFGDQGKFQAKYLLANYSFHADADSCKIGKYDVCDFINAVERGTIFYEQITKVATHNLNSPNP